MWVLSKRTLKKGKPMQATIKKVLIDGYYEYHVYNGNALIKECQTAYQANQILKGLL